jgi:hypothetical protein
MTMTFDRTLIAACLLAAALPALPAAHAQAPAAPDAKPAPAADAKDAAKDAAPAVKDAPSKDDAKAAVKDEAKGGPKEDAKAAAKDEAKGGPKDAAAEPAAGPLAMMSWLAGCWKGEVNKREFREFWHPPRGNIMVGVSRTALPERTISFEYLRLEPRADGIHYVSGSPGKPESAFKLAQGARDGSDEIYTFKRAGGDFPSTIVYRRAGGGWLYVEVAGQVKGRDDKVTYPFRRVDCETGEFIRK